QNQEFLESQFGLQPHHSRTYYPNTEWIVLEQAGAPAGRLYLDRQAKELTVVDISLLPEWRGRSIGTALMQAVMAEAHAAGKAVSIAVEKVNPAQRLYPRPGLPEGFHAGVYWV